MTRRLRDQVKSLNRRAGFPISAFLFGGGKLDREAGALRQTRRGHRHEKSDDHDGNTDHSLMIVALRTCMAVAEAFIL